MERQGSGFKKITETYRAAHNYRDELEPKFYSDASSFQVTLYNLNYGTAATANKVTIEDENVAIEVAIDRLNASQGTIEKVKAVFANVGVDGLVIHTFVILGKPRSQKVVCDPGAVYMNIVDTTGCHIKPCSLKSDIFSHQNIASEHRDSTSRGILRDLASTDNKAAVLCRKLCKNRGFLLRRLLHKGSARRPEIFHRQIFKISRVSFSCKETDLIESRVGQNIVMASGM